MKKNKFHPYNIKVEQGLNECDFNRRLQFCEEMMFRIDEDPNFHSHIVFFDEATFELNGNVNRHNCGFWADSNPNWMRECQTQYPQKLHVWAGILNDQLIDPLLTEGNLDSAKYENALELNSAKDN